MKIKKFNEAFEDQEYLQYFAEIKEIYPEFKFLVPEKSEEMCKIDFYTRHNHRFNFEKYLEIQSVINSKVKELSKIYDINKYEISVENYERATTDESYHISGRVIIKKQQ